jgi:hypothetical protein
MPRRNTTTPPDTPLDPELVRLVLERRAAIAAMKEVIRRVGPSTPDRVKVNKDRAFRRQAYRDLIKACEWQIVKRANDLVPHTYAND